MTYEQLVENINSLPPLSDATALIEKLYSKGVDYVDTNELIKIIESDALLTANILKMINEPFYGFSKKIVSISQAVTLFGLEKINGLVMHYAIHQNLKANTQVYGVNRDIFNDVCHLQSSLMMQWYSKIDMQKTLFLTPLALIMESGKLIIAQEIEKSDYEKEFRSGYKKCTDTAAYEDSLIGTTSYYLSGVLFNHWHLEPKYVEILKGLDYEDESSIVYYYIEILNVVRTAVNMKEILTKKSVLKACRLIKEMGIDVDHFMRVALRIKKNYIANLKQR